MSEIKSVLQKWSPERLALFLTLRGVEVPVGITRDALIDLAIEKRDVPIIYVKASKTLFRELTHEQLVLYLEARGYVVLFKGKLVPGFPDAHIDFQEAELLKGAIKDFEKNYSSDSEEINFQLQKILTRKYVLRSKSKDFVQNLTLGAYGTKNIELLLAKFGVDYQPISSQEDLWKVARDSINFFGTGEVY
ncbi:unnamed protein product [Kuraishia capsulata CBS 1993]|uniref:Uncharacterized protein n=1 Tax=Kuraishia capsulata CBS 1993 TaxID=1382522 RepID=W6MJ51_9ASCO|nr:uncharacterized protein KUCA_T00000409001 [Kuraishia capsulata CBS 1993]CDK24447.1 unnamed protein product [Kuraishia capsulata CBS 1993]